MKLLVPPDRTQCLRFTIPNGPSFLGPRIGGTRPEGLSISLKPGGQYIMTIPLATSPLLYGSIFRSCGIEEFIEAMNDGFHSDDRIQVVCHSSDLPRSKDKKYVCDVGPFPIRLGEIGEDIVEVFEGIPLLEEHHKIGGIPFCIQEPELPGADDLFAEGYVQVLQIAFPGPEDGDITGSWPFMDGIFNLFWKEPFQGVPYYWYLQK